jgi:hypothetical protein
MDYICILLLAIQEILMCCISTIGEREEERVIIKLQSRNIEW